MKKKTEIKKELKVGTRMEMEHTKNRKKAKKIAKDHLKEFPNYYNNKTGLPAMERRLKKKK
ncbi:hypothetical protein HGB13_03295 [bacterium]|nr:hypothetical protein [bacterium]